MTMRKAIHGFLQEWCFDWWPFQPLERSPLLVHKTTPLCACTYQSLNHALSFSGHLLHLELEDQRFLVFQREMQLLDLSDGPPGVHPNFPHGFVVGSWYLKKDING